jgi:hypothetical protein
VSSATHTDSEDRIAVAISEAHQKTRPPLVAHCWPSQRPPAQSYTMRSTHPASTLCSWNACKLQRSLTTPGRPTAAVEFTRLQVDAAAHCTAAVPCVSARCSAQLDAAVVESVGTGCVHASVSRVGDTPEATPGCAVFPTSLPGPELSNNLATFWPGFVLSGNVDVFLGLVCEYI